jgi:chorismate mutase
MNQDSNALNWMQRMSPDFPLVIAGPCSAETEMQVMQTAQQLQASKVQIYRAGIWKPRTRPGGFEGVGAIGLKWLQKAKAATGLKMAVEVANATHVKLALDHDIDVLWIGARTTVNPFAVQEIADALHGTEKIVFLKNPVNPDLSLWMGGLERLQQANIKNLGIIHRGFSTYEKTKYRNNPEWQIAIDFKNKFPNIPMIIDPSHISGRRDLIAQITQEAMDLQYDGMMIETHIDPENAWSDAAQQVTPVRLLEIIDQLILRNDTDFTDEYISKMAQFRKKIDTFDARILDALGQRMAVAREIGALKKTRNVAILQNARWQEILERMKVNGLDKGLSEEFIDLFYKAVHQESISHQEKVINK